jgi:hypothetical protein
MRTALQLLVIQGILGGFDTIWFHELTARLPRQRSAVPELRLHAARDFVYASLFGTLGWMNWGGVLAWVLALALLAEVGITLWDFVEEDRTRRLPPGERITHALMGVVYGAFLAFLVPEMMEWSAQPAGFHARATSPIRFVLGGMAVGVFVSGVRDLMASIRRTSGREESPVSANTPMHLAAGTPPRG